MGYKLLNHASGLSAYNLCFYIITQKTRDFSVDLLAQ